MALLVALEARSAARRASARARPARRAAIGSARLRLRRRRQAADRDARGEARAAAARRGPRAAAACSQARWKGEKTECGRPSFVRTWPMSATNRPGCRRTSTAVERRLDPPVARHRERRDVGGEVDRARADLARQRRQLLLRPPLAHDEVGAALAQRRAQLGQAAVQEPGAVAGREAAVQQPRVEHEHRHDAVALAVGGGQAGVVVDAQVAAEPDEGGGRHVWGTGERPGRT